MVCRFILTFIVGGLGGYLFSLARIPIPWTLGPLAAVILIKVGSKKQVFWPAYMRNIAMLVLGYVMGSPFTIETGQRILLNLPLMLMMTLITVGVCLFFGYIGSRYTRVSLATSLFGSIPGGISQMSAICEEIKEADPATVTLLQTIRVLSVVFFVPFIALHGLTDRVDKITRASVKFEGGDIPTLLVFATTIVSLVYLFKIIGISGRYIIAPIIGTAGLVLAGISAPGLPPIIITVAQICVGIRMGMAVNVDSLTDWKNLFICGLLGMLGVVVSLLLISYPFALLAAVSLVTAFISLAPGGMAEMGLTAMMVQADLSTVVTFQLFRLLFVLLVVIPFIRFWLRKKELQPS